VKVDVCVVGAGPAGSTLAARLAQLGHAVCLIERAAFPRPRLGESLSPGVLPLLEVTGARAAVEEGGFRRVHRVRVHWGRGPEQRVDPHAEGLLVHRGEFDRILLEQARTLGVHVLQPAMVEQRARENDGWRLGVRTGGERRVLRARLLADACGRRATIPAHRRPAGRRTVALYAYWRGARLPDQPRIEAGPDAWYWGVPLPDGSYNTLVFVDAAMLRGGRASELEERFHSLLRPSALLDGCGGLERAGPVRACDATAYLDGECVGERTIRVGDAALALDPLSSSGVQQAIRTALAGAVVLNTMLRRPAQTDAAQAYYRESLRAASARHRGWAAAHYATVARFRHQPFWRDRAVGAAPVPVRTDDVEPGPVSLSPELALVEVPCITGEFVAVTPALRHPALDEPLAFLGEWPVAPLVRRVRPGMTLPDLARAWSDQVPLRAGLSLAAWLLDRGILVPYGS